MSDEAIAVEQSPRSVAILGADALLVALPSTPTQLANACFAGGFDEVFPATWGDELIAAGCLEQLESRKGPAIFCACPLVAEQLRGATELRRFIVPLISPPVAVARYLRSLYSGDALRITYIGDCPGADDTSIDARQSPHDLLSHLAKSGILPAMQRPDLGTHAAHDRRRFYSIPGGVPSPQWLGAQFPKRTLVDVHAADALAGLANQTLSRGNTLIDFAPHLGCACAGAVGGNNAQDARKAVVALEPPRALSEIVNASVRIEVSLAPAGAERHVADVTWGDFLAALPAALAMHPESSAAKTMTSRTAPRRAMQRKAALPRAYMAKRASARRERITPARTGATQPLAHIVRAREVAAARAADVSTSADGEIVRREEVSLTRPNQWVARRASHEGMTGPRNAPPPRSGLASADRWLLGGLILTSSVLVAVLTSALTVRGIERTGASAMAARVDTVLAVAAAPVSRARDSLARQSRAPDTVLVASVAHTRDSLPDREEAGGAVAPPTATTRLSPMHARIAARETKREPMRTERRPMAIAEHVRTTSAPSSPSPVMRVPSISPAPQMQPPTLPPSSQPAVSQPGMVASTTVPVAAPAPAPAANAEFLAELRAIHAEIDARKRHMDSLTKALDSLKHVSPPK